MPFVEWTDNYSVGIQEFDDHHRHLVGLLNSSFDSFIAGSSKEALESLLNELVDYATYHFAAEEYWMRQHGYPSAAGHILEHENLIKSMSNLQRDHIKGGKHLSLEIMVFLKNWLAIHILCVDADYKCFAVESELL